MTLLSGQGLFVSAISGLNSTFSTLANGKQEGLTIDDILNPGSDVNKNNLNYNFISYLSSNFNDIDNDGDGKITASDISKLTETMSSKGMTYEEIAQMCSSGMNSSLLTTVLTYFNEIDKNGDGRVTDAEIKAYGYEADRAELDKEYNSYNPANASLFYADEDATVSKSTILDYKYPTKDNSSS